MNLKGLFQTIQPMPETEAEREYREWFEGYPLYFIAGDTAVFKDGKVTTMWAHCIFDVDGDDVDVSMLGPPPHHHGAFCWNESTWGEMLECDGYEETGLQWMLRQGIAPGQRVWIEVNVEVHGGGGYLYNGDWDDPEWYWSHKVMWIEPWTAAQVITAWEAYLG